MIKSYKIIVTILSFLPGVAVWGQTESTDTVTPGYTGLEELVVTARKEPIKSDGAKLTYDLEADDSTKGRTLLDALRNVPLITVDGEDNVRIKGDSNFKIYVNGKEDPMLTANASKMLKMIPAESISKIEVITEPGAKYDAEGTGGILNLVTERKQKSEGYTGNVSASAMTLGYAQVGLYGRMKKDNVTADANVNWFGSVFHEPLNYSSETRNSLNNSDYNTVIEGGQRAKVNYMDASVNMSWEPSEHNLFTFGGTYRNGLATIKEFSPVTSIYDARNTLVSRYMQDYSGPMRDMSVSGNVGYQHAFGDTGRSVSAAYRFNFGKQTFPLLSVNTDILNYPYFDDENRNITETISDSYNREHTAQIDYSNPWKEGNHSVDAGMKGIFRRNMALGSYLYGKDADMMTKDVSLSSHANQIQDVLAIYVTYTGKFDKLTTNAGVRYEHTRMGMDFPLGESTDFRSSLNDIVPNAALTYIFGPACNLRLAYQMRIQRPALWQLNPFHQVISPILVKTGNPDLSSERFNSLTLTYSNFGRVIGGNIGIGYSQANNSIEEYKYFIDKVEYDTYGNFGLNRKAQMFGFINWNITPTMSLSVNAQMEYVNIKAHNIDNLKNHGWTGNFGANWNYSDPIKVKYTLYGGKSLRRVALQGNSSGFYYYGLSIGRNFLKDEKLNVTLAANNFLQKYITYKTYSKTDSSEIFTSYKNTAWNISLSVSWSFGQLSENVKKGSLEIDNDDVSTKSNSSTGPVLNK